MPLSAVKIVTIGITVNISRNIIENTVRRKNLREEVFGPDRTKWPVNNWLGGDMTKIDAILSELQQKHNKQPYIYIRPR